MQPQPQPSAAPQMPQQPQRTQAQPNNTAANAFLQAQLNEIKKKVGSPAHSDFVICVKRFLLSII
jgi:hypothetical protein